MAIASVVAKINGTSYTLTYDSASGQYKGTITAPGATSYNLSGGYYNVEVTATNTAGTSATASGTTMEGLRLVVRETVKPVITFVSPTAGAYVINNQQPVVFQVTDESGGSGVKTSSVVVKLDGTAVAAATLSSTAITNGYQYTYTPAAALSDGAHTITVDAQDNDGNAAVTGSLTYTVDTVPPTLTVTAPAEGLVTNNASVTVTGTTNDATSSPVTVTITLNGAGQGAVSVGTGGAFSKGVTLTEGSNTIVVTATDSAGKTTSVSRSVVLDTTVPQITLASITPNPADTGATVVIAVTIT